MVSVCQLYGYKVFQSAPLTKARGDQPTQPTVAQVEAFQSAPLTKARGDSDGSFLGSERTSFNPLPSQKQGETPVGAAGCAPQRVFQSAPLTKARGDRPAIRRSRSGHLRFNPLPSQKQGETWLVS